MTENTNDIPYAYSWVLSEAVGWTVGLSILGLAGNPLAYENRSHAAVAWILAAAFVAVSQAWGLRGYVRSALGWFIVTFFTFPVAVTISLFTFHLGFLYGFFGESNVIPYLIWIPLGGVLIGGVFGLPQAWLFSASATKGKVWFFINLIGFPAALTIAVPAAYPLWAAGLPVFPAIAGLLIGFVHGWITATVLRDTPAGAPSADARVPVQAAKAPMVSRRRAQVILSILVAGAGLAIAVSVGLLPGRFLDVRLDRSGCRKELLQSYTPLSHVAISRDGTFFAASGHRGRPLIDIGNLQDGTIRRSWLHVSAEKLAFSPDGLYLAAGLMNRNPGPRVVVYELETGSIRHDLPFHEKTLPQHGGRHGYYWHGLAFSSNGAVLACGSHRTTRLWDLSTGAPLRDLRGGGFVAFSPDGRLIAARDRDDNRIVTAWRIADGTRVHGFRGHGQEVADAAFSSDGKQLATGGGYDNTVKIWRVADGAHLQTLRGEDAVHKVALSPCGQFLAAATERGMTVWWDLRTGRRLARTRAFKYAINDLGFLNGDSVLLWTAGGDRPPSNMCVRLWQVPLP